MKYLVDKHSGLFIRNEKDTPISNSFIAELQPVLKNDFKIKYGSTVMVVGSFLGFSERWAFHHGAARVVTVEPHPEHIDILKYAKYMGRNTTWRTPFQRWDIIRAAIHNRYDKVCRNTFCWDYLHVPDTSTAFSTVENRGRFTCKTHIEVKKYRFGNMMRLLYGSKIYPSSIIMDFDGVGATIIDGGNLFVIQKHGYRILIHIRDQELARLSDDYFDKVGAICDAIGLRYTRINNNFLTLF